MAARFLLDTNICIYISNHNPPEVRARFQQHPASDLAMSVVTLGELHFGAEKSRSRLRAMTIIEQLQSQMAVLPLSAESARIYGELRARLQREGRTIGNNDLWIAAHALAEGCVLVTNNTREFERVEGLMLENWVS
jgi:tRNA(fMet)-specific endonuclease VapC